MFDLRLTTSLINFHLKVKKKKKSSKCCCHFQTVLSASQLTGNASSSHTNPVFIHNPGILEERKKRPHHFRTSWFFFTLTGGLFEKVFKANEQHVRNFTTVSSETFILILSTSRTGCAHYFPLLPLAFLTLAAFSK